MKELIEYIQTHAQRGECQCGQCVDKLPDTPDPEHSVNVHFFWVSPINNPQKEDLKRLLLANYPDLEGLGSGPSYLQMGGALGDQGLALMLIGLGKIVGLWEAITPASFGITGPEAKQMAGSGFVMCSGMFA